MNTFNITLVALCHLCAIRGTHWRGRNYQNLVVLVLQVVVDLLLMLLNGLNLILMGLVNLRGWAVQR